MLTSCLSLAAVFAFPFTQSPPQAPDTSALLTWGDWNVDQRLDFIALGAGGTCQLFEAAADGSFADVSVSSGLPKRSGVRAAIWLDFNSDQLPDLLLVTPAGRSALLENTGVGFVEAGERSGLTLGPGLVAAQALDFDADSRTDLLLSSDFELRLFRNIGGSFSPVSISLPRGVGSLIPFQPVDAAETIPVADSDDHRASDAAPKSRAPRPPVVFPTPAPSPSLPPSLVIDPNGSGPSNIFLSACPPRIDDAAAPGFCLQASSVPAFGALYPLGAEFSIDPATDFVGINDTTPSFRLDVNVAGGTGGGTRAVGILGPTNGYAGVQGATDFDGVLSADWLGFELGLAGISTGATVTDNYGVMGHSNFVGVRGENSTAPTSNFGELGLSGVGVHASGTTAAGEFDGNVNVRDGDGDLAVEIVASATGTTNDLRVYRDGALGLDLANVAGGFQTDWINTANGLPTMVGGTSAGDSGGFWNVQGENGSVLTVRIDGDSDVAAGVSEGLLMARSTGVGGAGGAVVVQNNDGLSRVEISGGGSADGGFMNFSNSLGATMWTIDGEAATGGTIVGLNDTGLPTVTLDTDSAGGGVVSVGNGVSGNRLTLDGDGGDDGGAVTVNATDGSATLFVDGQAENDGGALSVRNDVSAETVRIVGDRNAASGGSNSGLISMFDRNGTVQNSVVIEAEDDFSTGSQIRLEGTTAGTATVEIDGSDAGVGQLVISEVDGSAAFQMLGSNLTLHNAAGAATQTYNRITGTKSAVVPTDHYGRRLLYALETPEVWFEDLGNGQLAQGSARIDLDPIFLETVTIDAQNPMKVFVSLTGDCAGVWIEKQRDHFVVHELGGGTGGATFDYRVIAKRRGVENLRLDSWENEWAAMNRNADAAATLSQNRPQDAVDAAVEPEIRKRDAKACVISDGALDVGAAASKGPVHGAASPFQKGTRPVSNESTERAPAAGNQR